MNWVSSYSPGGRVLEHPRPRKFIWWSTTYAAKTKIKKPKIKIQKTKLQKISTRNDPSMTQRRASMGLSFWRLSDTGQSANRI
jgi:hypothetical protein